MTWRLLPLLPLLAALAACGGPQDRYGARETATEAAQRIAAIAAADWAAAESVTVTLDEYSFAPDALNLRAGRIYALTLVNAGAAAHTFTAPGFFRAIAMRPPAPGQGAHGVAPLESVALGEGQSRTLAFVAVTPGAYALACERPLHGVFGMKGTIRIE